MKLSNIKKGLLASAMLAGASFSANAGVVATSYLDVQQFGIVAFFDEDRTQQLTAAEINQYISVSGGLRSSSTSTGFNGAGLPDSPVFAPTTSGEGDAVFNCTGTSCATVGLTNNALQGNYALADQIHTDSLANGYNYAMADGIVDGSALSSNAQGMTYAAASVGGANNVASGNADITDSLTSIVNVTVNGVNDIYLAFVAAYSVIVDVAQSADVAANSNLIANATASGTLSAAIGTDSSNGTGGTVEFNFGGGYVNVGPSLISQTLVAGNDDFTGSDTGLNQSTGNGITGFYKVSNGDFQVAIVQESTARVSLVPAPGTLALAGLGILGLASIRRKRA